MVSEKFQKNGLFRILKQIFTVEFLILLLWIPCVIFIFKFIDDRKIAGLAAGTGFLFIPVINIFRERLNRNTHPSSRLARVFASGAFFILSAMPIFLFRVFNWDKNLEDISVFGLLSGRELHSLSNIIFVGMVLVYFVTNIIDAKKLSLNRKRQKKTALFKAP